VLLLNPDVEIVSGVEHMARACEEVGVAAAGGRLLGNDGRPQAGFLVRKLPSPLTLVFEVLGLNRLWRRNPVNRNYRCLDFDVDREAEVEQPPGAFIMIRRQAWRRLGGFDETFFPVWFEDVDFCRRAVEAGFRILYVPDAVANHAGGGSIRQLSCASRWLYWYATLLSYAAKHFRPMAVRVVSGAVILGALLRAVLGFVGFGGPGSTMAAARVIKLAGRYL
jgi:GT2 family glycosyltransferase